MALVWMLEGPKAGRFVPCGINQAKELVASGKAQWATTPAEQIKQPTYSTKEMVADTAPEEPAKPKAKRKSRKKKTEDNDE